LLRKTVFQWEFESELALENFVWANLEALLELIPLKRQYCSNGEFCDILALDQEKGLVIIELKNSEDRYIIQQLTRYYDSLIREKPCSSEIDYQVPIRLIAITPIFHKHNLVDRLYNKLEFQFLRFRVSQVETEFYLSLEDIDKPIATKIKIPYQEVNTREWTENISTPTQVFLEALGAYPKDEQRIILGLRHKILTFEHRIQEITTKSSIQYGRGKNRICAEFFFDKKKSNIVLFLWLPFWRYLNKNTIGRHKIWTDWRKIFYFAHTPEALGLAKPEQEWKQIPKEKWPRKKSSMRKFIADPFHKSMASSIGVLDASDSLESLIDLALSKWLARL